MSNLFLTGVTGAVGLPLAARLLAEPSIDCLHALVRPATDATTLAETLRKLEPAADLAKLRLTAGDLTQAGLGFAEKFNASGVTEILHAAAFTKFKDPASEWTRVNVGGTREMLHWRAANCPQARFLHFSTLCAAGRTVGPVPEAPIVRPEGFVNGYEKSKWEAEQLVQAAPGPVAILRLATVIGSEADGSLRRVGAFHHVLRWVYRGLLPLIPGHSGTKLDLVPTEYVVDAVSQLLETEPVSSPAFYNCSRGAAAIPLSELIEVCATHFRGESETWRRGQVDEPVLASIPAFEEFRRNVLSSRDMLFTQVLESVDSFLPELFFPKQFETRATEALFGGCLPLGDWQPWLERVLEFSLRSDFGRQP